MNVLVTGGAGYVGSAVSAALIRAGHRVTVYDNLSRGKRKAVPAGAELVVGEVADRERVEGLLRSRAPDAVMHFAAWIEAGESMQVPERYFRNNSATTLTLLEAMLACGRDAWCSLPPRRFMGTRNALPSRKQTRCTPPMLTANRSSWWSGCSIGSTASTG